MPSFQQLGRVKELRLGITVFILLSLFALIGLAAPSPIPAANDNASQTMTAKLHPREISSLSAILYKIKAWRIPTSVDTLSKVNINDIRQKKTLRLSSHLSDHLTDENAISALPEERYQHSIAFTTDSWPLMGRQSDKHVNGIAKTWDSAMYSNPKREALAYTMAGQLIDAGVGVQPGSFPLNGRWWLIVEDLTRPSLGSGVKRELLPNILASLAKSSTMTKDICQNLITTAIELTQKKVQEYAINKKMLHLHAGPMAVYFVFDSKTSQIQDPELTDWINWEEWSGKTYDTKRGSLYTAHNYPKERFGRIKCNDYQQQARSA